MTEEKWQTKVTHSPKACEIWTELCNTYPGFGDLETFSARIIEGKDRSYDVFFQIADKPEWIFLDRRSVSILSAF